MSIEEYWEEFGADAPASAAAIRLVNGGSLISSQLTLSHGLTEIRISYNIDCHREGGEDHCTISSGTRTRTEIKYAALTNNGGSINTDSLIFESNENQLIQNSGKAYIGNYSGNGVIDLNGGSLTLGKMSSGAVIESSNAVINAEDINLTSRTFTASNTTLNTALTEIAEFRQDITKTDALNLSGNDSKVSFIAFQPLA